MIGYHDIIPLAQRSTDINEYLLPLYGMVVGMNAKIVVELGAGQSTYALTAAVNETKGTFYSIDIGEKAHLREYPEGEGRLEQEPRCVFILGDDRQIVKGWGKQIDFLLIDTSHIFEHTNQELQDWPKWVRKGGVIAMHDTAHEEGSGTGCRKALDEFLKENKNYYVLHLLDTKHLGLSVLIKL